MSNKDWFDDDESWFRDLDSSCMGCGELNFRESRIPGLCDECEYDSFNATKNASHEKTSKEDI